MSEPQQSANIADKQEKKSKSTGQNKGQTQTTIMVVINPVDVIEDAASMMAGTTMAGLNVKYAEDIVTSCEMLQPL